MKVKITSGIMLTLLLANMLTLASNIQPAEAEPRIWTVDDDGSADFDTIQAAINAASDGDTIRVRIGTYYENVVLDKSLSLIGEDRDTTIIDGMGTGIVVNVTASNTTVGGFTIRNADRGIRVFNLTSYIDEQALENTTIFNNNVMDGIYLRCADKSTIVDNEGGMMHLHDSCSNTVTGNNISSLSIESSIMGFAGDNIISCNNITHMSFWETAGNVFYHNNIAEHPPHDSWPWQHWDQGYPTGGNYWINYTGVDEFSGPYQNETGSDGIGDTPYLIDLIFGYYDQDNYPLMNPYGFEEPTALLSVSPTTVVEDTEEVTFDASDSYDPDGSLVAYWYDYGDGYNSGWTTEATHYRSYPNLGEYDVKVKVKDNDGLISDWSDAVEITVMAGAPAPTIVSVDYPEQVFLGDTATITVIGENGGDESPEAYLHVAFPFNPNFVNVVESDATNQEVFWPGDTIWGGYGEYQITAYYPVAMAWEAPWQEGLQRYLTVEVTPEEVGTFVFEVKMPARYSQNGWVSDPSIDDSELSVTDQQDEYVYQYQIEVVATSAPDFEILVLPESKVIYSGEAGSYIVTVNSLDGYQSPVQLRYDIYPSSSEITLGLWTHGGLVDIVTPPSDGATELVLAVETTLKVTSDLYLITVWGTGEGKPRHASATLEIEPSPALEARRTLYENYAKMIDPGSWENDYEEQTKRIWDDTLKNYYDPLRILANYVKEVLKKKGWYNYLVAIDLTEAIVKTCGWWQVGIVESVMGFAYSEARLLYQRRYDGSPPDSAPDEMLRIFDLVESGETREAQKAIKKMLDYLELVKEQTGSGPVPYPASEEDWRTLVATMFDDAMEFLSGEYSSIGVSMKVTLGSPADLHVYDPDGRHVGINYDTDETEVEIPYAYYSGPSAENQDITIPDPVTGDYTIVLIGTSTGSYSLTTELILQNKTVTQTHTGDIVEGDILESIVTVSENGMTTTPPLRLQPDPFPWWILGAVIVVMVGVGVTLILWKRRKSKA